MGTFELGVLLGIPAGFVANLVFLALLRVLPPTLVRYSVSIGQPYVERQLNMNDWYALIRVGSPTSLWRVLLGPLTEYLEVRLSLNGCQWMPVDTQGFGNPRPFRIDGVTTIPALILSSLDHNTYLMGDIDDVHRLPDGQHSMRIRVLRALDESPADEAGFRFTVEEGEVTLRQ